jgi:hypothetical protein
MPGGKRIAMGRTDSWLRELFPERLAHGQKPGPSLCEIERPRANEDFVRPRAPDQFLQRIDDNPIGHDR